MSCGTCQVWRTALSKPHSGLILQSARNLQLYRRAQMTNSLPLQMHILFFSCDSSVIIKWTMFNLKYVLSLANRMNVGYEPISAKRLVQPNSRKNLIVEEHRFEPL
jgi:hypothetical protein